MLSEKECIKDEQGKFSQCLDPTPTTSTPILDHYARFSFQALIAKYLDENFPDPKPTLKLKLWYSQHYFMHVPMSGHFMLIFVVISFIL